MNSFQGNEDTLEAVGRGMCFVKEQSTWKCFYPISTGTEVAPTQLQLLEKSVQAELSSWLGPNGTRVLLSFQGRSPRKNKLFTILSLHLYSPIFQEFNAKQPLITNFGPICAYESLTFTQYLPSCYHFTHHNHRINPTQCLSEQLQQYRDLEHKQQSPTHTA